MRLLNLALLALYPVAWYAPLARAGILPLFGGEEVSVATGLAVLWETDRFLFGIVLLFAVIAPWAKTLALALVHYGQAGPRLMTLVTFLGRLAMADVFLVAVYVALTKGVGIGYVEVGWGLYYFTALVLVSLAIAWATERGPAVRGG